MGDTIPVQKLLADLRRRDIRIWVEGDRLRFNAPRGAMTSELQASITAHKTELVRFLGTVGRGESGAPPPIERASREGELPLSYAQQRVWFLHRFDPSNPAYNVPAEVLGGLRTRPEVLARALEEILRRHEGLRTRFVSRDGEPFQVIDPPRPVVLPVVDLSGLDAETRARETKRLSREEAARPFDLERGPVIRFSYLERRPDRPVLLLTQHHIATDRWSLGVLAGELSTCYHRLDAGTEPGLSELPVQYADYAQWQRRWLESGVLDRQLEYWKPQLAAPLPVLDLPTDRPRPPVRTSRGAWRWLALGRELSDRVKQTSRREGVTLFTVLLAAFYVLLHRYSGQTDLTVGTPVTGRGRKELEKLIGLFVNTLVLRCDLEGEPTFEELLRRVRQVAVDAFSHADMPFEKLVEVLQPERDTSRSPLFQVMFVLQNAPDSVEVERIEDIVLRGSGATMFDLTLTVAESALGLTATFEYNTDLFEASTMDRMLSHYRRLLEAIGEGIDVPIRALPLLTDEDRARELVAWNRTSTSFPDTSTLPELFEEAARRSPEATAVVSEDASLSYEELDERSRRLARRLRELGARRGALVGVALERSTDLLVTLLGILRTGAAYVPLDPAFPERRLRFMVKDSGLSLLVTRASLRARFEGASDSLTFVDLDAVFQERTERHPDDFGRPTADDLAYVIYTSGSTGEPKGVAVTHRSVVNFLTSMRARPGLSADDVLLSVTTLSFDIAGLELYLPLTTGATVILAGAETASDAGALTRLIDSSKATVLQATPATWRLLLEGGWKGREDLAILCGGEALPSELARALLPLGRSLWNLYGPTETTIWSAVHEVKAVDGTVPIGRPIANTRIYVVDEDLEPVPVGVVGELYIGGEGLARGYLGRSDLTAERFVPDPFSETVGARLYRTGDLARYRADGALECLGRSDQQVKVRGFRIELGDVEAALERHENVLEAAVVAQPAPEGNRLVAFVTTRPETSASDLRTFLKEQLPGYMVPSLFVVLDALPLTPNGKVDRRALASRGDEEIRPETPFEAPRTPVEETIASVWSRVLRVPRISIHDNFFELGGHSLLATAVLSRVQDHFGVEVPLRFLFERPTVAGLSAALVELSAAREEAPSLDAMLEELERMSDDEARVLLGADERRSEGAS